MNESVANSLFGFSDLKLFDDQSSFLTQLEEMGSFFSESETPNPPG